MSYDDIIEQALNDYGLEWRYMNDETYTATTVFGELELTMPNLAGSDWLVWASAVDGHPDSHGMTMLDPDHPERLAPVIDGIVESFARDCGKA